MSDAWDRFLEQYEAEGSERLDGYDETLFDELTDAELARAQAMVIERAAAGETPEIRALPLLDTPEALRCVDELMARERELDLVRLAACEAGWKMTEDPAYQDAILEIVQEGDEFAQARAINVLGRLPLTPEALADVTDLLRAEEDRTLAVELAQAVLRSRGVAVETQAEFERALPLVRALANVDLQARGAAIDRVDALVAAHRA